MKNKKLNILRLLFIFVIVALASCFMLMPVSALERATLDYDNYISNVVHENGNTYAVISCPAEYQSWYIAPSGNSPYIKTGSEKVTFTQYSSGAIAMAYYPFGHGDMRSFSLDRIPYGTTLTIACDFYLNYNGTSAPYMNVDIVYLDQSGDIVGVTPSQSGTTLSSGVSVVFNIPMLYPSNAKSFFVRYNISGGYIYAGQHDIWCETYEFQLYMDTVSWNMLHTNVDPIYPDIGDDVDSIVHGNSGLLEDIRDGINSLSQTVAQSLTYLQSYISAFAVTSMLMDIFIEIPFMSALLVVSLSLGVSSLVICGVITYVNSPVSEFKNKESKR